MSKEKVIEIKINDVTYNVSEVNRNDDQLKEIIKDMLIEIQNKRIIFLIIKQRKKRALTKRKPPKHSLDG